MKFDHASLDRTFGAERMATVPRSLKPLLENVIRNSPGEVPVVQGWLAHRGPCEISFFPARILMHDTTCLPALADIASMRDAVAERGGDPERVNPTIPVDLVVDHSIAADTFGRSDASDINLRLDFQRNAERYRFVKWAQRHLANFRVVPPGMGIIHQVNIEFLASVVRLENGFASPDTLLGTDSHTPMINALGVLGWGVGGIEAQAAMVGQPVGVSIPRVVGVRLAGRLRRGVTATDAVLELTQRLRAHGVVGKFVEFFGDGVASLSLPDRATISNMAPEYGATVSFFPQDAVTMEYLRASGRPPEHVELVEAYARAQGLWAEGPDPRFDETLDVDLGAIEPCMAGPSQPDERRPLSQVAASFLEDLGAAPRTLDAVGDIQLFDGMVALAAITSCTNTSNPALVIGAGLLARNARRRGLRTQPWVKTSLSPGSQIVSGYLKSSGLQDDLDALGFQVVGHGCMTCIGNSGRLLEPVVAAVERDRLRTVGVLSGNRNFHGRVNPHLGSAYLGSPALVVAYALAGSITWNPDADAIGNDAAGAPVFLRDLWPDDDEIAAIIKRHIEPRAFAERYRDVWAGTPEWAAIQAPEGVQFPWDPKSTYIRRPPHDTGVRVLDTDSRLSVGSRIQHSDPSDARVLFVFGDNVTTDHISPAGAIPADSLAGRYLMERGVQVPDFNQYSTRRSNHEVMLRGAFTNPKLHNELPNGIVPAQAFEAAEVFRKANTPLVIVAGRNYGAGSSRDWAAKAPRLLGVRAIIAESFERLHRSNLIGMGLLPMTFTSQQTRRDLALAGDETLHFTGLESLRAGHNEIRLAIRPPRGPERSIVLDLRIDSRRELETLRHGGFLPQVVHHALSPAKELP